MEEQLSKIKDLILKSLEDDLSVEESAELHAWLNASTENEELYNYVQNAAQAKTDLTEVNDYSKGNKAVLQSILQAKAEQPKTKIIGMSGWKRFVAVAAVFFAIVISVVFIYRAQTTYERDKYVKADSLENIITPGKNGAKLILEDGTEVVLGEAANGVIAKGENSEVNKLSDGKIAYHSYNKKPDGIGRHILKTGKGEQFEVSLPDGSTVRLNSVTQIIYPPVFTGETREVILTSGEAFFKISKDATRPFHLNVKGLEIVVLGTEFNIHAHNDEAHISSTLFNGKIKGNHDTLSVELEAGQQLKYDSVTKLWKVVPVDLAATASWINGLFTLNNADAPTLLREIARWYDIEIVYSNGIPKGNFEGQIPRSIEFDDLIKVLNEGGIRTKVEGRKLIIM